jgi:hypothetical protein
MQGEVSSLELEDAKSAVGRPFPSSPSVIRTCATPDSSTSLACKLLMEFLEELVEEPRNIPWAREMEERFEKAIAQPDPEKYTVRAIECRSTRCAVEVAAPHEYLLGHFDDPVLEKEFWGPTVGVLAFEEGPNGEKVIVTTLGYLRR